MKINEKFPWPIEEGAAVDFTDGTFLFVLKDDTWNEAQLESMKAEPLSLLFGTPMDLGMFLLEGGALDTCDFYFDPAACDALPELLQAKEAAVDVVLVDGNDSICFSRKRRIPDALFAQLQQRLGAIARSEKAPDEFEVNAMGLMSAYEPAELAKFADWEMKLKK